MNTSIYIYLTKIVIFKAFMLQKQDSNREMIFITIKHTNKNQFCADFHKIERVK